MFAAYGSNDALIRARDAVPEDGPFCCPECRGAMILKHGHIKRSHFSHVSLSGCQVSTGEGEAHRQAKFEIADALRSQPGVTNVLVEYGLGDVRADIYFRWQNRYSIDVEIQFSDLPVDMIFDRTQRYARHGIYVLWVIPYTSALERGLYTPVLRERYIHALYFGTIIYWRRGDLI